MLAIKMNWHNSRAGFWLNALTIGAASSPDERSEIREIPPACSPGIAFCQAPKAGSRRGVA
jgi:hypothetical protein